MSDVLLVFARYPQAGVCKTRLIPQLGAEGAAELHRQLTHHTLTWARDLADSMPLDIQVHVAGGTAAAIAELLGDDLHYLPQTEGDLGQRLQSAFQTIAATAERIVVVGTDCPQLTAEYVRQAFERLADHDVCVGPAADGGYTLLGLGGSQLERRRQLIDRLFTGIDWGTERVLTQTIERLDPSDASLSLLPTLHDIDEPEDLEVWQQIAAGQAVRPQPELSVIIPTYNHESLLPRVLDAVLSDERVEAIVVAAGDVAHSRREANEKGVQLLQSPAGRWQQMNRGASVAAADSLMFLHADTLLPSGYVEECLRNLARPQVVGGAFALRIDCDHWLARGIQQAVHFRSHYRQLPYGDQALYVRKSQFQSLAGFAPLPIMEDYDFVRRLRRKGRVVVSRLAVTTSARRWQRLGFVRTTLVNQLMILGYHGGCSVERLAQFYRRR